MRYLALIAAVMVVAACNRDTPCPAPPPQQASTATEVFQLRGECAQLGDKILNANTIGSALRQDVVSNYDAHENRCYVDLTVMTADLTMPMNDPGFYLGQFLYDGQTKELLAGTETKGGKEIRLSFKDTARGGTISEITDYINKKMGN